MHRLVVEAMGRLKNITGCIWLFLIAIAGSGCLHASLPAQAEDVYRTPMARIPAGEFIMGSTPSEREYAYRLDEKLHNSSVARNNRWFEVEKRRKPSTAEYIIDFYPVTNKAYKVFVKETATPFPFVDERTWRGYRLVHPYSTVRRFLWRDSGYPEGRGEHPVVLVPHEYAEAYCRWRGAKEGRRLRLPTEEEWEKAARGEDGRFFPWGDAFDPKRLNSYDEGPFDTEPVGSHPDGMSPYGLYDMAGEVFEWTSTPAPNGRFIVKGGSWDDLPGVTRPAARHARPANLKHILIGFRCAGDLG